MASSSFLKDKNAVITGGSGTIGLGMAQAFLSEGCNVYITGRSQAKLDAAISKLDIDEGYGKIFTLEADCTSEESVIRDIFGKVEVDLLINNAGTSMIQKTEDLPVEVFKKVMDVNVNAPFLCSREAIKQMKSRNNGGRIINIGSISAISSRKDSAAYTTSKFALLGLTHSLALDCRDHNIAVGIIHPGNVISDLLSPAEVERRENEEGFMQYEDVAKAVVTMGSLPYHANIFELTVMPTKQPLIGRG